MALENTDLLVAYRPAEETHYKLSLADLPTGTTIPDGVQTGDILEWNGSSWVAATPPSVEGLPDGTQAGQYLVWTGTVWEPSNSIDGGIYAA